MYQAFIIVLREGFESFLIVAIILAYLKKTNQSVLIPTVNWGIFASVFSSALVGYLCLLGANQPLWEGILGIISALLVTGLVLHMWKTAPHLKQDMEKRLAEATYHKTSKAAHWGVFLFTVLMITREGMETALLLIQVHEPQIVTGIFLGLAAAAALAFLWMKLGHLINLKLFFQVTAIYLLLFVVQILIYSFHEFTETGLFPNTEKIHWATEVFSPDGLYGKWFSLGMVIICLAWLMIAGILHFWAKNRSRLAAA